MALRRISVQAQLQEVWDGLALGEVRCGPTSAVAKIQFSTERNQGCSGLKLSRLDGLHQRRDALQVIGIKRQNAGPAKPMLQGLRNGQQPAQRLRVARHVDLEVDVRAPGLRCFYALRLLICLGYNGYLDLGRPTSNTCRFDF